MSGAAPGRRLAYQPALDGLRGVAVASVVLFHSELSWARGGYLGVSTFFTLSGFLICSLLLAEHRDSGKIDLGAFWSRRFRRLMPASLLGLVLAIAYGALAADSTQLADLRGDVAGALAYAANWRFTFGGDSYSELFTSPSPLLHFWSLAIEEQFYLVFPLVVVAVVRRGPQGRAATRLALVLACLAAASVAISTWLTRDGVTFDRAYFGTDARAAELLIGALLAVWWHHMSDASREAVSRRVAAPAAIALVALIACWSIVDQSSAWLYRGGLALYAMGSAVVILGAIAPSGAVRAVLSVEPLRQLGRYSYGVYVIHWPVFLWLSPQRTELSTAPLLAVRLVVTAAIALASFHLLEQPIRTRRWFSKQQLRLAAGSAIAAIALGAVLVTAEATAPVDFEELQEVAATRPAAPNIEDLPTISFYGDSTALMMGLGFADWQRTTRVFGEVSGAGFTQLGCGFMGSTAHRYRNTELVSKAECDETQEGIRRSLSFATPDICVVMSGPWNVPDRKLPGEDVWRAPGDPAFDAHLRGELEEASESFEEHGCVAVWVLMPYSVQGTVDGVLPPHDYSENELERVDRLNELITEVVEEHAGHAATVDLPGWMETLPDGYLDTRLRPDLVHFGWENGTAQEVADRFLGRAIYDAYRSVVGDDVAPPLPPSAFTPTRSPPTTEG